MQNTFEFLPGVKTVLKLEGSDLVSGTVQDCTPIAEQARAMHNEGIHGSSEMRLAAKLPMVLIEKYCNDKGITFADWMHDKSHVRVMLSDPALSHFRVWGGQV